MLFYAACDLQAFKLFDTDGDGVITTTELKELVAKVGALEYVLPTKS